MAKRMAKVTAKDLKGLLAGECRHGSCVRCFWGVVLGQTKRDVSGDTIRQLIRGRHNSAVA